MDKKSTTPKVVAAIVGRHTQANSVRSRFETAADLLQQRDELLELLVQLHPILWNDGPLVRVYEHLDGPITAAIRTIKGTYP